MKKKVLTTIILIMFCTLVSCQCVKAETEIKTTIQIKKGARYWNNISASDAYDKCQELNEDNSALGITGDNVMAHLSTNADWFAVGLLMESQFNGNNSSSVNGPAINVQYMTAGLIEEYIGTNSNFESLIANKDTPFVEKLEIEENKEKNKPGLGLLSSEQFVDAARYYYARENSPGSVRIGIFGYNVSYSGGSRQT